MPKKSSVPLLPPLSFSALQSVRHFEDYAHRALSDTLRGLIFNQDKAIAILRTCAVSVLDIQINYYRRLHNFTPEWVSEIKHSTIKSAVELLDDIAEYDYDKVFLSLRRTIEDHMKSEAEVITKAKLSAQVTSSKPIDRNKLRDLYFANFPNETIKILDVCWAVGQHYREWKRWLKNEVKDGSTPDLAFRRILTSGKKPLEFNKKPRPTKWQ